MEVEPVMNGAAAIALADALDAHDVLARARRRTELERHHLPPLGRLDTVDLVELLHPALHLRRMAGPGLEPLDEGDFLGQHGLLPLELRLLVAVGDFALALVEFVVAAIARERPASISRILLTIRFMNSRSCEVISSAPV